MHLNEQSLDIEVLKQYLLAQIGFKHGTFPLKSLHATFVWSRFLQITSNTFQSLFLSTTLSGKDHLYFFEAAHLQELKIFSLSQLMVSFEFQKPWQTFWQVCFYCFELAKLFSVAPLCSMGLLDPLEKFKKQANFKLSNQEIRIKQYFC